MTTLILLAAAAVPAAEPAKSHDANEIFRTLLEEGVQVTDKGKVKLPAPTLPDGQDEAGWKAAVSKIIDENKTSLDEMTANRPTAPFEHKVTVEESGDPAMGCRLVNFWYFAHGDIEKVMREAFRKNMLRLTQGKYDFKDLSPADLAKRKIALGGKPGVEDEYITRRVFGLFDKIELAETNRVMVSRTKDSIIVATILDRRFLTDPEFPCQWKPLTLNEDGSLTPGEPRPFTGVGYYIKITKVADGMMFVEAHFLIVEPKECFPNPAIVQSKLPILLQTEVRRFRRELTAAQ